MIFPSSKSEGKSFCSPCTTPFRGVPLFAAGVRAHGQLCNGPAARPASLSHESRLQVAESAEPSRRCLPLTCGIPVSYPKLVAFSCHFSLKVSETALNTWQLFLKMDVHDTFVTSTYENLT